PVADRPQTDRQQKTWTAAVVLSPGTHEYQFQVDNGSGPAIVASTRLTYKRPPHSIRAEVPRQSLQPQIDMLAQVVSALELSDVQATVNDRAHKETEIKKATAGWTVFLRK